MVGEHIPDDVIFFGSFALGFQTRINQMAPCAGRSPERIGRDPTPADKPALDRRIPDDDISARRSFTYQMFCYMVNRDTALDGSKQMLESRGETRAFHP
jgi:hypothetical protein